MIVLRPYIFFYVHLEVGCSSFLWTGPCISHKKVQECSDEATISQSQVSDYLRPRSEREFKRSMKETLDLHASCNWKSSSQKPLLLTSSIFNYCCTS